MSIRHIPCMHLPIIICICLTKDCSLVNLIYTDWVLGTKKLAVLICREPNLAQSSGNLGNADVLEWELEWHPDNQALPNLSFLMPWYISQPFEGSGALHHLSFKAKKGQGSLAYPFQCWFSSVEYLPLHCTVTCLQLALQCSNRSTHVC